MTLFKVLAISLFFEDCCFLCSSRTLILLCTYWQHSLAQMICEYTVLLLILLLFPSSVVLCLHLLPASFCTFEGGKLYYNHDFVLLALLLLL